MLQRNARICGGHIKPEESLVQNVNTMFESLERGKRREERIAGAGRVVEGAVRTSPPCLKVLKIKEEREGYTPPFVW